MSIALTTPRRVAIIGGGPAGLMAAETVRAAGHAVDLYEAKGSPGRKFLIAGKGGLNLTHSDAPDVFVSRYRERAEAVGGWLADFNAEALRAWALDSAWRPTWAVPAVCSRSTARPRRCCAAGCAG